MIQQCPAVPTGPEFLEQLLRTIDCLAVQVSERSFGFLSSSGGLGQTLLLTSLTLLIVVFGYRLIFGPEPSFGATTSAAIQVGIVLALATSWPAVSRVIVGPLMNGPAELTAWSGPADDLVDRLGKTDSGIVALTSWGTGRDDIRAQRTAGGGLAANATAGAPVTDAIAFGGARLAYLLTAIGSVGLVRLLTGILIGLAPIFAGLLLFERTRGIFSGWARTLFALLIIGGATRLLLLLELMIINPWLGEVIRQRQASLAAPWAATELLAMTMAFGLISMGVMALIVRACLSIEVTVIGPAIFSAASTSRDAERVKGLPVVSSTGVPSRSDRIMQIAKNLERVEQFRSITRSGGSDPSPAARSDTGRGPSPIPHTDKGRLARRTLLAQRRDVRA